MTITTEPSLVKIKNLFFIKRPPNCDFEWWLIHFFYNKFYCLNVCRVDDESKEVYVHLRYILINYLRWHELDFLLSRDKRHFFITIRFVVKHYIKYWFIHFIEKISKPLMKEIFFTVIEKIDLRRCSWTCPELFFVIDMRSYRCELGFVLFLYVDNSDWLFM